MIIKSLLSMLRSKLPEANVDIDFNAAMTALPTVLSDLGAVFTRGSGKIVRQNGAWVNLANNQFGTTWTESAQKYAATINTTVANLFFPSEGTVANASTALNVTDTTMNTFSAAIHYGDNSVERQYLKNISVIAATYKLTCFIEMDDGGVPVIGTTSTTGDFSIIAANNIADDNPTVEHVDGTLYRVSSARSTSTLAGTRPSGIIKYTGQSSRGFKVTGWQLVRAGGNAHFPYIKTVSGSVTLASESLVINAGAITGWNSAKFSTVIDYVNLSPTISERYVLAIYKLSGVSGANATDYVELALSSSNKAFYRIWANNVSIVSNSISDVFTSSQIVKHGFTLQSQKIYQSINGVYPSSGGSRIMADVPARCDTIRLASRMDSTLNGGEKVRIFKLRIWCTNLLQSQLNTATK